MAKIKKIFESVQTGGKLSSTNDQDEPNSPDSEETEKTHSLRTFFKALRRIFFVVSAITLVAVVGIGFVLVEFLNISSRESITPGDTYSTPGANLAFLVLVVCVTAYGIAQHRKKKSKAKSS